VQLYLLWKAEALQAERFVLKDLGFSLYSGVMEHPHRLILYYCRALDAPSEVAQAAWTYLNDSLRLDLCVRVPPEAVACAALFLAAGDLGFPLPTEAPWFEVFNTSEGELYAVAEDLLSLYPPDRRHTGGGSGGGGGGAESAALQDFALTAQALSSWLPSLRSNAQPGEDEDVGEGAPLGMPQREPVPVAASASEPIPIAPLVAASQKIVPMEAEAAAAAPPAKRSRWDR
jgi:hypothetical protein